MTGRKVAITIKTLNGEREIESTVLTELRIESSGIEDRNNWLNLPATCTRKELPADVDEVARREEIECWDYLKGIVDKVPQEKVIEVGLLIGANCARVLEPKEVIPSKNGGPFTFHSQLGWCVARPLTEAKKKGAISCNIIVV